MTNPAHDEPTARPVTAESLPPQDATRLAPTDAGLDRMTGMKELQSLRLTGTRVTAAGVRRFRDASPACKVDVEPDRP